jgi:hypothetical protein
VDDRGLETHHEHAFPWCFCVVQTHLISCAILAPFLDWIVLSLVVLLCKAMNKIGKYDCQYQECSGFQLNFQCCR